MTHISLCKNRAREEKLFLKKETLEYELFYFLFYR